MTRNLYLGADLGPAISCQQTRPTSSRRTARSCATSTPNNFPVRAKGLAKEILGKEARPGRPAGGRALADRPQPPAPSRGAGGQAAGTP